MKMRKIWKKKRNNLRHPNSISASRRTRLWRGLPARVAQLVERCIRNA